MTRTSTRSRGTGRATSGDHLVSDSPDGKGSKVRPNVGQVLEQIVGCKWSRAVIALARRGVTRPGAMERETPGLSTKVLYERLRKLERLGVLERVPFPEIPPRVEYRVTAFGERLYPVLDEIDTLSRALDPAD